MSLKRISSMFELKRFRDMRILIPAKPKKAPTPFLLYFLEQKEYLDNKIGITYRSDIISKSKDDWATMTDSQKQQYKQKHQLLRYQFMNDKRDYANTYEFMSMNPKSISQLKMQYQLGKLNNFKGGNIVDVRKQFGLNIKNAQQMINSMSQDELDVIQRVYDIRQLHMDRMHVDLSQYQIPKIFLTKRKHNNYFEEYISKYLLNDKVPEISLNEIIDDEQVKEQYNTQLNTLSLNLKCDANIVEQSIVFHMVQQRNNKLKEKHAEKGFMELLEEEIAS